MDDTDLLKLWGKTRDKSDPDPREYHPLLYHLIDVGVAAEALWPLLPSPTRKRLTQMLGVKEEEARRAIVLLVALHDLGKASGFQAKVPGLWARLNSIGLTIPSVNSTGHHAFITAAVLPNLLLKTDACGIRVTHLELATDLSCAIGAHHGTFPHDEKFDGFSLGGSRWDQVREALARRLVEALFPGEEVVTLSGAALEDAPGGVLLTGLTAVADWIGSNQNFFTLSAEPDIRRYTKKARNIVQLALKVLGWLPKPIFASPCSFASIAWGRDAQGRAVQFSARGVQSTVVSLLNDVSKPFLLLIEAAMGEGKTEAALFAADTALTGSLAAGLGISLPTQATGNAMFERTREFLELRGHSARLNLQLIHGQATFHLGFQELRLAANGRKQETDQEAPVVAESWFTNKKQALLAPFGVGTIDQSLMGVLQTKHWFVRLFGLAGKVVVFDEVHAYDAYMNELLLRLIAYLSALDCTVILLSATLPATARKGMIAAYAPNASLTEAPYPRVTLVSQTGEGRCESPGLGASSKSVRLATAPPDYLALVQQLQVDLPAGGCAVVICNTVGSAQGAYSIIRNELAGKGWQVELFHARTPLAWRQRRESMVLDTLGKPTRKGVLRPQKLVLVGTQVLEQSLDFDADWMASEFAPVDLLLQRMGRLWRHTRENRPTDDAKFTLLVSPPTPEKPLPVFPAYSDLIYDRYLLLRTFLLLQGREKIHLPEEIETLVKAVYDEPEPEGLSEEWHAALMEAKQKMERDRSDKQGEAEANLIELWRKRTGRSKLFSQIAMSRGHLRDEEDPLVHKNARATTRLGDPSLLLVCLREVPGGAFVPYCGGEAFDKNTLPRAMEKLMLSTISVSRPRGLFFTLINEPQLPHWADDAHLRYARHLVFDSEGKAVVGKYRLRLSEETGLSSDDDHESESDAC